MASVVATQTFFWNFHPENWGRWWTHFDDCNIFQMGWFNHKPDGFQNLPDKSPPILGAQAAVSLLNPAAPKALSALQVAGGSGPFCTPSLGGRQVLGDDLCLGSVWRSRWVWVDFPGKAPWKWKMRLAKKHEWWIWYCFIDSYSRWWFGNSFLLPLFGDMIPFDQYFSRGLKPPTTIALIVFNSAKNGIHSEYLLYTFTTRRQWSLVIQLSILSSKYPLSG